MRTYYSKCIHQLPALLLAFVLIFSTITIPCHASVKQPDSYAVNIEASIDSVIQWYLADSAYDITQAGTSSSLDWFAFSLGRLDRDDIADDYLTQLNSYIRSAYITEDKLDATRATEWHRICLAMTANGQAPSFELLADGTFYRGYVKPLDSQGVNGVIWALLTLDSLSYELPADACDDRSTMIAAILNSHIPQEGFTLTGGSSDIDITANALTALAPYYVTSQTDSYPGLASAVEEALAYLSANQTADGGFISYNSPNAESCAQVLIALISLGIDPLTDERFLKNGHSVLDALLAFQNEDGGFAHLSSDKSDAIASSQSLLALTACKLYLEYTATPADNKTSYRLYQLTDCCDALTFDDSITYENYNDQNKKHSSPLVILIPLGIAACLFTVLSVRHIRRRNNHGAL